jgi:hypothetical protein
MPITIRINPSWVLPTSPIKILAFGQFQYKKPATDAISKAVETFPVKANKTEHMIIASRDANPSTPSIKLKRFINQTIPMMAIGYTI